MGMGSQHRNIEELPRQHVGGAFAAADYSSPCTIGAGIRSLSPPSAELHYSITFCGIAHAGGLGGNQTLMIDNV